MNFRALIKRDLGGAPEERRPEGDLYMGCSFKTQWITSGPAHELCHAL